MRCSHCGKEIDESTDTCPHCGRELSDTQTSSANDPSKEHQQFLRSDMLTFVGQNNDYYEARWNRMGNHRLSSNYAAFLLSIGWIGYRKMYKHAAIVALLLLVFDLMLFNLFPTSWTTTIAPYVPLSILIVYGMFGNYFYRNHVRRKVQRIRNKASDQEEKQRLLKKHGGRSGFGVLISFLLILLIYILPISTLPLLEKGSGPEETRLLTEIDETEDVAWQTYDNTAFGYIVDYPASWEVQDTFTDEETVVFSAGKGNEIKIFAEPFDGDIERITTGITEEIVTNDGHFGIINRTDRGKRASYRMSIVEGEMEYQLTASLKVTYADEHGALIKELIERFQITNDEQAPPEEDTGINADEAD